VARLLTKPLVSTAGLLVAVVFTAGCGGDADGEVLASLDGTSWSLAEGEGIPIPDGVTMTIAFAAGRVSGSGGCNRFTGTYEEAGESISFGALATTRMACADEVMAAERTYLAALETVSSWTATDAELVLSDDAADELLRYDASSA
jgi:heat shock protein HslJ